MRVGPAALPVITVESRIIRDVYGCPAGRDCIQATPEQRAQFEQMIADRLAALSAYVPEAT